MTEVGISVSPAVFSTMNRICASVARSGCGFSVCSSCMAFRPSGVAALSSPSRLAETFITIAPCAGWPGGTPGNSCRSAGAASRASASTMPARSPMRRMPSHSAITPTSPMEMSKPVRAESNIAASSAGNTSMSPISNRTAATAKALTKKASQMRFRSMGEVVGPAEGWRCGGFCLTERET